MSLLRSNKYRSLGNARGVGIVAVMMMVTVLMLMGGVIASIAASGAISRTNDLVREKAFYLTQAGFEYALKRISEGINPNGQIRTLGGGQFTVNYPNGGQITIAADVSALQGHANQRFSIQGPTTSGMADCLIVGVTGGYLANSNRDLRGLTLRNGCQQPITIASMTTSWSPTNNRRLRQIRIENSTVYNNNTGIVSGAVADISDTAIPGCTQQSLSYLRFNADMAGINFTIQFNMLDGTSKTANVLMHVANEADCLLVNLSGASIGGSGYAYVQGGSVTNVCGAPATIRIESMNVSWVPDDIWASLWSIQFNGSPTEWQAVFFPASNGETVTLTNPLTISSQTTIPQSSLEFDADMRGHNFTIVYGMRDGSSKSASLNLYEGDMAACLGVNNAGTTISGSQVIGQQWTNSCGLRILVTNLRTTWSGSSRRLYTLTVGGVTLYDGSASSGSTIDIEDVELVGGASVPVNAYQFSGNMTGRCFTHRLTTADGGTKDIGSYCP